MWSTRWERPTTRECIALTSTAAQSVFTAMRNSGRLTAPDRGSVDGRHWRNRTDRIGEKEVLHLATRTGI